MLHLCSEKLNHLRVCEKFVFKDLIRKYAWKNVFFPARGLMIEISSYMQYSRLYVAVFGGPFCGEVDFKNLWSVREKWTREHGWWQIDIIKGMSRWEKGEISYMNCLLFNLDRFSTGAP